MSKNNELNQDALEQVAGGVEITPELIAKIKQTSGYDHEWDEFF